MKRHEVPCDNVVIDAFMNDQLSAEEVASFERHLDGCAVCRERLQQRSANDEFRAKAADYLGDVLDISDSGGDQQLSLQVQQVLDWLAPTDDPRMLGRVGSYEVLAVIGSGGMGVVLKTLDLGLNRVGAIKVLAPHLAASDTARTRFSREAQAAAAITHDNVIDIYSVSEFNGLPYLVMPYARGPSLQERLDRQGPLPLVEVLRIGHQIGSGLMAAHEQGLVHRDVKPANILLTDDVDRVLITDFGLARTVDDASLTNTGDITGTPHYMSPEQARGGDIDQRSDLFSLGSVIYTLCTATPPFRGETNYGVLRQITDSDPQPIHEVNPEIPKWLGGIVARLHAKNPDERFQSAKEVADELRGWLAYVQNPSIEQRPRTRRASSLTRKSVLKEFVLAIGLLAACIVGYVTWLNTFRESTEEIPRSDVDEVAAVADGSPSLDTDFVTRKRMKAIVFAMHSYADANDRRLPPAVVANPAISAKRRLSGFALLLPYFKVKPDYLDQLVWETVRLPPSEADKLEQLYQSIDLTKAWDDPVNLGAARTSVPVFLMPGISTTKSENGYPVSHVAFVRGYGSEPNGAFPGENNVALYSSDPSIDSVSDGTARTLAIGQISENLGPWIAAGEATARYLSRHEEKRSGGFGGAVRGTAFFARCDASLNFVDLRASEAVGLRALATRAGNDDDEIDQLLQFYDSVAQYLLHKESGR